MTILFFIERWTAEGWERISAPFSSMATAKQVMRSTAEKQNDTTDNYSILVETNGGV